jgi:hypothetical protein
MAVPSVTDPVQLELELPLDPVQLSRLTTPERGSIYREAGLDPLQIAAAEEAVRLVLAGESDQERRAFQNPLEPRLVAARQGRSSESVATPCAVMTDLDPL